MQTAIALILIFVCIVRIVNYGIYTVRDGNRTGGAGLFIMAFLTALSSVYFFIN